MITSDEVNYLIYRYLLESGFSHSAFCLGNESLVMHSNIDGAKVPHGSLIAFLQKGLLYTEIETHLNEDGTEKNCDEPFTLTEPHVCQVDVESGTDIKMEEDTVRQLQREDVCVLQGHASEVFTCAWNPRQTEQLASGSGDSTARIWTVPSSCSDAAAATSASQKAVVLRHLPAEGQENSMDVTSLDWNPDGTLLCTGSYDGKARLWHQGQLQSVLAQHKGPIFSLKWNKAGDSILTGSVDHTAIIWDAASASVKQQFQFHRAPTLDADWRNNTTFATCSTDRLIYICKLGETRPLKVFEGHQHEVNAVKWDNAGNLLASCSDDLTAKVWKLEQDRPVHDFREHEKEIYTIEWSPTGAGSANPNLPLHLATASFDATIKLWDAETGQRVYSLEKHTEPVYSVSFSPNGEYLASGSFDNCLHLWSMRDGSLIRTYQGSGGIFDVCWNSTGDKVAASFADHSVVVLDFNML